MKNLKLTALSMALIGSLALVGCEEDIEADISDADVAAPAVTEEAPLGEAGTVGDAGIDAVVIPVPVQGTPAETIAPTEPATTETEPVIGEPTSYTIEPGDTLSEIALQTYGDASAWPVIAAANKDHLEMASMIHVGHELRLPAEPVMPRTSADAGGEYVVRSGDTLADIATDIYGDAAYWSTISMANDMKIENPHMIRPGTILDLPAV